MNLPKNKRINADIVRLINNNHIVRIENLNHFTVLLNGPSDTPYKSGVWIICVTVNDEYPFKPPIVKFKTKIYHPNVDQNRGIICLDVLNETWSPIFDMLNIFENFLPQLLKYPNPHDALNSNAAQLMLFKPELYEQKVLKYVEKYAREKVDDKFCGEINDEKNRNAERSSGFVSDDSDEFQSDMVD